MFFSGKVLCKDRHIQPEKIVKVQQSNSKRKSNLKIYPLIPDESGRLNFSEFLQQVCSFLPSICRFSWAIWARDVNFPTSISTFPPNQTKPIWKLAQKFLSAVAKVELSGAINTNLRFLAKPSAGFYHFFSMRNEFSNKDPNFNRFPKFREKFRMTVVNWNFQHV